ncbi:hypothetical protein V8C86DRAFT_2550287 [Haematococcus lacustris]
MPVTAFSGTNQLYGTFREETGVLLGDPYGVGYKGLQRHQGKQFAAPFPPKGTDQDGLLDKATKLTVEGDHYQEPRDLAKEVGSHRQIHGKPFVPGSGPKDRCGSGSLHGIFGPASGQLDTDASLGSRSPNKLLTASLDGKRSIYVNPSKKGTYGYPLQDRSIGQTRYDFIPDEYMRGRILDREMKREARAKVPKPFLATSVTNKSPLTVAAIGPATKLAARGGSAPSDNRKPWKASNPAPRGRGYGALSAIEYIAAPPQMPLFHKEAVKPFRPGGGPYSRLSMWPINPFQYAPRPAPSNEFTLLA